MHVGIQTDNHLGSTQDLHATVESEVERVLVNFDDRLTHVEVHLADESGGRDTPTDIRCTVEGVLEGQPAAVATHHADTVEGAVSGAVHQLKRVLESRLGRISAQTARRHA